MNTNALEWVKALGPLLVSWPVFALVLAAIFRRPLMLLSQRLSTADESRIEISGVRIELGKLAREGQTAVVTLNRLSVLMAESRLLELEITAANFGAVFTAEHRDRMQRHIDELRKLTTPGSIASPSV